MDEAEAYANDQLMFRSFFVGLKGFTERITGRKIIHTIADAEPLGPKMPLDALVIAPCTGNTLAKIAQGITDTPVTMAAKAHLREDRPLLLALASNDSMSANLENISKLLLRKQVFFVPMRQDDPERKPHSLVADFTFLSDSTGSKLTIRAEVIFYPHAMLIYLELVSDPLRLLDVCLCFFKAKFKV